MAEIKGIDVSSWNGTINWKTVADYGMGFAILRVHQQSGIDSTFEYNYKGCTENKIPVGVYKYSYAKTVAQAEKEAQDVLNVLNGRKLDYPVFYDLEWDGQRALGKVAIEKIAVAFLDKIEKAGYKVGLYANCDWYRNYFTTKLRSYDCWLAAYPANDNGTLQERLKPEAGIGWQYSSKAKLPGIDGVCDRNVFYKDYSSTSSTGTTTNNTGGTTVAKTQVTPEMVRTKMVEFMLKIANNNSHGYSQAVRSLYNYTNGKSYDCSSLVLTAIQYAFDTYGIKPTPKSLGCSYTGNMLNLLRCGFEVVAYNPTAHSQAQMGDIELNTVYHVVMFKDRDTIIHARTSEGTSNTIDDSGNEIRTQAWYLYSHGWTHRLRFTGKGITLPTISTTSSQPSTSKPTTPTTSSKQPTTLVGQAKLHLNNFTGSDLSYMNNTRTSKAKKTLRKAIQIALNIDYKAGLKVDGVIGDVTKAALRNVCIKNGSKGYLVTVLEIALLFNKINPNGVECPGICGSSCVKAVKAFQKKKGLKQDGEAGILTFTALLK